MPTESNADCGALIGQVISGSDPEGHSFSSYTIEQAGPPKTITFTLDSTSRLMTKPKETITFEISDSNTYGAVATTTVTINLYQCDLPPLISPAHTCLFYMNVGTGGCAFPENTVMDTFCDDPLDFQIADAPGSSTLQLVSTGSIAWASQSGGTTDQTLLYDFSSFSTEAAKIALIGVYSAERLQSAVTETFEVVLCYFAELSDIYFSPSDDVFEYNRAKDGGVTQEF